MKQPNITIALDFDGTVVSHRYPLIGEEAPYAVEVMKKWIDKYRVGFILDTMRDGKELEEAIKWFSDRGVVLYAIGKDPDQAAWTTSSKAHANFSIDDRNIGCPMKNGFVDWETIDKMMTPVFETYQ